ncbi:hypothetical protein WICMUC_001048 [Wickerhamomyces mucosus]|uniref:Pyridoxal phosphate homeostasis protein n=1 Tax=Wickerhamomyces mucosus TaxID=1378264 RepID=A0A9P8PVT8_9ASCO|nr:hypothetical protein WICMUC_001048 [Wickerhamomyces mucosus]
MSSSLEYTKERQLELWGNYNKILSQINSISEENNISRSIKLLPVTKFKPASDIKALYDLGLREFGENYVQELLIKSELLPKDIKWHFIGGLQSNKPKDLKIIKNLTVETIDSLKKAKKLNESRIELTDIYLQINVSNEDQKYGISLNNLNELDEIIEFIIKSCQFLNLKGLMCIGSISQSQISNDINPDFEKLQNLQSILNSKYQINLQLSMGMSSDFKQAIKQGTSLIRIGTDIFGSRP